MKIQIYVFQKKIRVFQINLKILIKTEKNNLTTLIVCIVHDVKLVCKFLTAECGGGFR
jgi:hypothetical protein